MKNDITFMRPQGLVGATAARLLTDAGLSFTTIFKSSDSKTSLSVEGQPYSWKGVDGIKKYLATLTN